MLYIVSYIIISLGTILWLNFLYWRVRWRLENRLSYLPENTLICNIITFTPFPVQIASGATGKQKYYTWQVHGGNNYSSTTMADMTEIRKFRHFFVRCIFEGLFWPRAYLLFFFGSKFNKIKNQVFEYFFCSKEEQKLRKEERVQKALGTFESGKQL